MGKMPRLNRDLVTGLLALLAWKGTLRAQDSATAFLVHPEGALPGMGPGPDGATLAPLVDGSALCFAAPQIAFYRNTGQAEFVSAVWNDGSGEALHQRDVLLIKPDYGVIVDYVHGTGRHTVVRGFAFPSGTVTSDARGAQPALPGGVL
jgi:hypothetical protein